MILLRHDLGKVQGEFRIGPCRRHWTTRWRRHVFLACPVQAAQFQSHRSSHWINKGLWINWRQTRQSANKGKLTACGNFSLSSAKISSLKPLERITFQSFWLTDGPKLAQTLPCSWLPYRSHPQMIQLQSRKETENDRSQPSDCLQSDLNLWQLKKQLRPGHPSPNEWSCGKSGPNLARIPTSPSELRPFVGRCNGAGRTALNLRSASDQGTAVPFIADKLDFHAEAVLEEKMWGFGRPPKFHDFFVKLLNNSDIFLGGC